MPQNEVVGRASLLLVIGIFLMFVGLAVSVTMFGAKDLLGMTTIFGAAHALTFWPFTLHAITAPNHS